MDWGKVATYVQTYIVNLKRERDFDYPDKYSEEGFLSWLRGTVARRLVKDQPGGVPKFDTMEAYRAWAGENAYRKSLLNRYKRLRTQANVKKAESKKPLTAVEQALEDYRQKAGEGFEKPIVLKELPGAFWGAEFFDWVDKNRPDLADVVALSSDPQYDEAAAAYIKEKTGRSKRPEQGRPRGIQENLWPVEGAIGASGQDWRTEGSFCQ